MPYRLAELAERVGGRVEGNGDRLIEAVRPLETAGERDLSFLTDFRYRRQAEESAAGALLVGADLIAKVEGGKILLLQVKASSSGGRPRDLLVVDEPVWARARLIELFHPRPAREPGVHPTAVIEAGAEVDPMAHVGPYAVVGAGSRVGARAAVLAHVVVGRECTVAEGTVLHPHVVLYDGTEVGEGSEVHAGAVLGADGFGYATVGGVHHKVPQVGRVVVEAGVEIGANTTIDRATLGETRVGAGSKIDNLVQVGHNVRVGKASVLCGQAGIAGSTHLGDGVVLAGQAGVGGHLTLGDGVRVAAKAAALTSVEAGATVAGIPAVEIGRWRRQAVLLGRLEEMARRLAELEKRVGGDRAKGREETAGGSGDGPEGAGGGDRGDQ